MHGDGCTCHGCGQTFRVDIMVPDDIWDRIRPPHKPAGAGLLCPTCIVQRIEATEDFAAFEMCRA